MFHIINSRRAAAAAALLLAAAVLAAALSAAKPSVSAFYQTVTSEEGEKKSYIKWVDFSVPYELLEKAYNYDVKSYGRAVKLDWVELLAYVAAKCGGNFSSVKKSLAELDKIAARLQEGENLSEIAGGMKYYSYYLEAYGSVLGGFLGEYSIEAASPDGSGEKVIKSGYGLKAFSPIAKGYPFGHYDDFGTARSYGFKRVHLGNDLMGAVGTPIIAVEGGVVEALGWNQYGGWRIGIRSHDGKRYYYYAHLRKNHPYVKTLEVGDTVEAGDVIGYLGMTGYSTKENVNNIKKPHLHFGMQLIFDESQKDGVNQIWIDVYNIVKLLSKNKSAVAKNPETKDYYRLYSFTG